jgi:prepilin-type N-terminal cleavage/methylation domain-containing protein
MSERGFTVLESLVALGILGVALAAMVPSFQTFMDANSVSETRSNGLAAAQEVMEILRQQDPSTLPTSGASSPQAVQIGEHVYEVVARYCESSEFCNADSRHIIVEVSFAGKSIYVVETVYTRLR